MAYFTSDFIKFFKDLAKHNHKEWFNDNRKRYKESVKDPFYTFIDDLIEQIQVHDPSVQIQAKDAVMRINRDIRFSPDKTPYNLHYGAIVSSAGRKDKSIPGLFLRFSPEMVGVFGGAHGIDKDQLYKIRKAISNDPEGFQEVITEPKFVSNFGSIQGEQHKRIPPEFQSAHQQQPLIANKQFYYLSKLSPKLITDEQLMDRIMDLWHIARPVKDFLTKAMN
jgi:uncharacterized protein (TIGR02453 family)